MWPQALQMTRDECRGILRRLELESYSQVISVFRAQGGLSDAKAKLLEELRGIFHISNERHRAESRRVANDEQLATIAEAISGPNTWQEWSREGRRPYPMLPRVAPQTALALIANNVAEETVHENSKLPYPAETAEAIKEEQQEIENHKSLEGAERNNYVVTNDPFKIPEIPTNIKKNLKRNINSEQHSGMGKKRNITDNSLQKNHTSTGSHKQYPHITANSPQTANSAAAMTTPTNISERKQKLKAVADEQYILKQRFFHHQHQMTKQKMAKKVAGANNAAVGGGGATKRQATPAKSGRRANQKMLMEQQKQQMAIKQLQMDIQQQHPQQQQQVIPMQIDLTGSVTTSAAQAKAILTQQQLDMQFVTYAQQHQPPQQIFMEKDIIDTHQSQPSLTALSANQHLPSLNTSLSSPQIAASKRDISKNLNKLHLQQTHLISTNVANSSLQTTSHHSPAPLIPSHDLQTSLGNILGSSSPSATIKSSEKSLISTTPVQKYIVEERQPGLVPGSVINLQNPSPGNSSSATTTTHIIQVSSAGQQSQIMTLPQFSAAATKLRAVNTTLIAPGAKITATATKKITNASGVGGGGGGHSPINAGALHELANVASTQSQVLHIVESAQASGNNSQNAPHVTPLHTPPAVIQIHNASGAGATATSPDISLASTQTKVLTTKILPLVLTATGNQTGNNTNTTLINNPSLVAASSPTTPISITSTITSSAQPTIIKNLPSTLVLNTSTANLTPVTVTSSNNAIISSLGAGGTVFRKPPNIIKTSQAVTTPTKSSSSSSPHIISNVKLTPVNVSTTSTGTHLNTTNSFKNVIPSTAGMVRTSVKICQSPNGKVFIQPAGLVDATKMKINTSSVTHKIISNTSLANASSTTGGGQRIAIQKVQIIPAPIGPPAGAVSGTTLQSGNHHLNTKPTTITGKNNMIFMPTSTTNVRPVTLSKMGNNILLKSSSNQHLTQYNNSATIAGDNNTNIKPNIVVLGPSPSSQTLKEQNSSTQVLKLENNQLINEDTPLDILNMPIVMETGVGMAPSETVTVLQSNIIETSNTSCSTTNTVTSATPIILEQSTLQPTQTVILGATDWEMELDQAITTAANNNQHNVMTTQNITNQKTTHKQKRVMSSSSNSNSNSTSTSSTVSSHVTTSSTITNTPINHKETRLTNDLISTDLKTNESNSSSLTTNINTNYTTSNSSNNVIVVDDSFDDVIVEEHEDDPSASSNKHDHQHEDIPKILDMQIYQQHDGHDNKIAQILDILENDTTQHISSHQSQETEESSTVNSEQEQQQQQQHHYHQQQPHQHECEIDAGFDETIITEIDENTAIEYIEEDGVSPNMSITTTTTTTYICNKNNVPITTLSGTSAASKQDDTKTGKHLSITTNNNLASSTATVTPTTNINEIKTNESTTTANTSATQQVEP